MFEKQRGRKYCISTTDGQNLYKNEKYLELVSPGAEDGWTTAFKDTGIYRDIGSSMTSMNSDKVISYVQNHYLQSFSS